MVRLNSVYKQYKKGGYFSKGYFEALKNIDIEFNKGEHIGIIGESGAGKTTLARLLSLIELPTSGSISFNSTPINNKNIQAFRKKVGMVFQDPSTSFNPRLKIIETLKETSQSTQYIEEICENLNINKKLLDKFPRSLSGGEQQRIAIARAILSKPLYIIFDEATSALDLSTQAKIINLLLDLNKQKNYAYIFITHDIKLANFISDKIYVLYKGYIVELLDVRENKTYHPYTKALINNEIGIASNTDNTGCPFYSLCSYRKDICKNNLPKLKSISENSKVRCFLYD